MKKNKKPAWKAEPQPAKEVRFQTTPESTNQQTPAWQFHKRDREHAAWGWDRLSHQEFCDLVYDKLANFESMTWDEILKAAGGRNRGNNSHNVTLEKCCKDARDRLAELMQDDIDELFSLRLTGTHRLWGIKEGRVLRFIWNDPDHSVYPLSK